MPFVSSTLRASAAWHVSLRVTERLASVLTSDSRKRAIVKIKKEGVLFMSTPGTGWDGYLPLLAALFLSTLFRHSSSLKLERSAEKPGTEVSLGVV